MLALRLSRARAAVNSAPTDAQKQAGNYRKGHVSVHGLRISIENPRGSVRTGMTDEGRIWRQQMSHDYGYIKGSEGNDGDQVDCFIGDHPESHLVYVIDQIDPKTGRFDEHKAVLGSRNEREARAVYQANYPSGWKGIGAITALPMGEFHEWLDNHDTRAPMAGNRVPAQLMFVKADVKKPGSRGGHGYYDDAGKWQYGEKSVPRAAIDQGILSPSGRVSARARKQALERVRHELFGAGLETPKTVQPSEREALLRQAAELRELADRGMSPKKYRRRAEELEAKARSLAKAHLMFVAKASWPNVQQPGSRGGRYWIDDRGFVRYGVRPEGRPAFPGVQTRRQIAEVKRPSSRSRILTGTRIERPRDVANMFRGIVDLDREQLWAVHLDKKQRLLAVECVSMGSLTASIAHPRDVLKNALTLGTASIALVHNHPSGERTPSPDDRKAMERIGETGERIGVPLSYGIVVSRNGFSEIPTALKPNTASGEWGTEALKRKPKEVEGRVEVEPATPMWQGILGQQFAGSTQAYQIAKKVLDPDQAVAVGFFLDQQLRVIGVFPVAAERLRSIEAANEVLKLGTHLGAARVLVAAGRDGDEWNASIRAAHQEFVDTVKGSGGIDYLDTMIVSRDGGWSRVAEGPA
jgi:hypothetical protein